MRGPNRLHDSAIRPAKIPLHFRGRIPIVRAACRWPRSGLPQCRVFWARFLLAGFPVPQAGATVFMDVKLPKLGEGSESGVVVSILVKAGQEVTKGQTILELENEKAVAPIPAPAAGTIAAIRVKEGDRVAVGQVVLTLTVAGEATASAPAPTRAATVVAAAEPEPARDDSTEISTEPAKSIHPPAAAPSVRLLARQLGDRKSVV